MQKPLAVGSIESGFIATKPVLFLLAAYGFLLPFENLLLVSFFTVHRLLSFAIVALVVLAVAFSGKVVKPPRGSLLAVGAYVGLAIASLTWTANPEMTSDALQILFVRVLLYGSLVLFPFQEEDKRRVLSVVAAGGLLASIVVVALFLQGRFYLGELITTRRVSLDLGIGVTADPNYLASTLLLPMLIYAWRVVQSKGSSRVLPLGAVCVILLAIGLTGSRGVLLAAVTALSWFVVGYLRRQGGSRTGRSLVALGVAFLVVGLAISISMGGRYSAGSMWSGFTGGRLRIWRVGFVSFYQRPFLGHGFGAFREAYEMNRLDVPDSYPSPYRVAHSTPIQSLVELGIVGVTALFGLAFAHWRRLRQRRSLVERSVLGAALIGILISSLFLDMVENKVFWFVLLLVTY